MAEVAPIGADFRSGGPDQVLNRELDGELVLLELDREEYLGLDPVGTALWRLLAEGTGLGSVVRSPKLGLSAGFPQGRIMF